jgi:predicted GTPase
MRAGSETLRAWYREAARGFLQEFASDRVDVLDRVFERLDEADPEELPICFLGNAGVGKSTLINALVAGPLTLVPQGGVGPLTAQATLVRYSEDRRFRAEYWPAKRLNRVLFAIERAHERQMRRSDRPEAYAAVAADSSDGDDAEFDFSVEPDIEATDAAAVRPSEKIDALIRQVCLIVLGTQFPEGEPDVSYLLDALRACLGLPARWGSELLAEDGVRVRRVQALLARADSSIEMRAASQLDAFVEELELHASGFLSPLIKTLEVWWDAEPLRHGLVLVDLPGVGIANDQYRRVTAEWIRRARAIVLVVDRAGVTEASADLLRSTGFLTSLLHEAPDPEAEGPVLMVGVVKLDLVAESDWSKERERLGAQRARKWTVHFDDICHRVSNVIVGQMRTELEKIVDGGPESTRDARDMVVKKVLATLQVHPVSAWEYRKLLRDDDEERPRISDVAESRMPGFVASLSRLGVEREARLRARAHAREQEVRDRVRSAIDVVLAQWREGVRAEEEAEKLEAELAVLAAPLLQEFHVRQGAFREFLRECMPEKIRSHSQEAAEAARKDIKKYLRRYDGYHWATLRATVRRGGAFVGSRHIDLPNDITLRFEEPLAVVWSHSLLVELRRRTRELADDHVRLVGTVLDWALAQKARVRPELVASLDSDLKAQARELNEVGKEAIDDLKARVKQELFREVEGEVRKRCRQFVDAKRDVGRGTKDRILEFIRDDLTDAVVEAAKPQAAGVLEANYRRVEKEIQTAFRRVPNPVESAIKAIASGHEEALRRSDAQRRKAVLARGEELIRTMPPDSSAREVI